MKAYIEHGLMNGLIRLMQIEHSITPGPRWHTGWWINDQPKSVPGDVTSRQDDATFFRARLLRRHIPPGMHGGGTCNAKAEGDTIGMMMEEVCPRNAPIMQPSLLKTSRNNKRVHQWKPRICSKYSHASSLS